MGTTFMSQFLRKKMATVFANNPATKYRELGCETRERSGEESESEARGLVPTVPLAWIRL